MYMICAIAAVAFSYPQVMNRYLFGSPRIPELLFVVGRLDQAVLDAYSQEREEAYRSNQALYQISNMFSFGVLESNPIPCGHGTPNGQMCGRTILSRWHW